MTKDVTEWCPSCDREVEMKWDVEAADAEKDAPTLFDLLENGA